MRTFAEHRHSELFPPYDRPGTKLFNDFCDEVIRRWKLADKVYPAKVIQILPIKRASRSRFQLEAESDAAVALYGCDCPVCINALRRLQS